ncbi:FAD-binding domain-containing protein [Apiospora rasikravindrae]|uniref:FAD-binding domain-containing protein n=1 Tax=Apiospora rasikravindrae TaxID=990691 RepID=A0ABR1T0U1_9PEZI
MARFWVMCTLSYATAVTCGSVYDACKTAHDALGDFKVDTAPLDQTVVDKHWSETCNLEPYCIFKPTTSHDVSELIQIVTRFEVKFAVRSGGHSPNPGWSGIDGRGVLFDLEGLNHLSVSEDGREASFGPGAKWLDILAATSAHNVSVLCPRTPDVGVGGFLLGGGVSFTANQFGLATSHVRQYEVVLGNGSIVSASGTHNSDLFWALKGGGANFGIVTGFDVDTIPANELWYALTTYPSSHAEEVLDAMARWQLHGAHDLRASVQLVMGLDSIIVLLCYSEVASHPASFEPFYRLPGGQVVIPPTNSTFHSLMEMIGEAFASTPGRHDYRGVASAIDARLYKDVYRFWEPKAKSVRAATGWTTTVDWEAAQDDDVVRAVSIETTALMKRLSQARGLDVPFLYMNDASRDQNPIASYGSYSVERMKQVSQDYDREQVFQKLQNDGFLLKKLK